MPKKLPSNIAILREITQKANKPRLASSVQKALEEKPTKKKDQPKNIPTAGALGRLGALEGGKARMKKACAKRRQQARL